MNGYNSSNNTNHNPNSNNNSNGLSSSNQNNNSNNQNNQSNGSSNQNNDNNERNGSNNQNNDGSWQLPTYVFRRRESDGLWFGTGVGVPFVLPIEHQHHLNNMHRLPPVDPGILAERHAREESWDGSPRNVGSDMLPVELPRENGTNSANVANGINGANSTNGSNSSSSEDNSDDDNNPPSSGGLASSFVPGPVATNSDDQSNGSSEGRSSSSFSVICFYIFSFITYILEQLHEIFFM